MDISCRSKIVILKLYDYDQEWIDDETKKPIALTDGGMSLYLSTSATAPTGNPTTFTETVNESGAVTNTTINQEYVDLLGVGAAGTDAAPPAYNKFFHNCMNKDTAIRRIDFRNNKNNAYAGKIIWSNNKPIISCRDLLWGGLEDENQLITNINTRIDSGYTNIKDPNSYTFVYVHVWSNTMDNVNNVVNKLNNNSKVRIVSPDTFIKLIINNVPHVDI